MLSLAPLRQALSFHYDDHPMGDSTYASHGIWIKYLHDYFLRVRHIGELDRCLQVARRENVILISNHALTIEALIIGYLFLVRGAGRVGTMVFREAFKLPLIREFFRSCQCVPISVEAGADTLMDRHILIFPEGMDFLAGLANPDRTAPYHTGFLHIAKEYLRRTGRRQVTVVPVAHAGIEKMLKFWIIKNEWIMSHLIRPLAKYPFWVIPKTPFFLPSKVVVHWGKPVRIHRNDLRLSRKFREKAGEFRETVLQLRKLAYLERERATMGAQLRRHVLDHHDFNLED
ncbi:MAG: 1-acyl-sn-glycerol-3-phosphate acyltransferase [bacterium]